MNVMIEYMYGSWENHGLMPHSRQGNCWDLRIKWRFRASQEQLGNGLVGWLFQEISSYERNLGADRWETSGNPHHYWEMWEVHRDGDIIAAVPSLPQNASHGQEPNRDPQTVIAQNHFNDTFLECGGWCKGEGREQKKVGLVYYLPRTDKNQRSLGNWGGVDIAAQAGQLRQSTVAPPVRSSLIKCMKRVAAIERQGGTVSWHHGMRRDDNAALRHRYLGA
jgi:hypothetical protein